MSDIEVYIGRISKPPVVYSTSLARFEITRNGERIEFLFESLYASAIATSIEQQTLVCVECLTDGDEIIARKMHFLGKPKR